MEYATIKEFAKEKPSKEIIYQAKTEYHQSHDKKYFIKDRKKKE